MVLLRLIIVSLMMVASLRCCSGQREGEAACGGQVENLRDVLQELSGAVQDLAEHVRRARAACQQHTAPEEQKAFVNFFKFRNPPATLEGSQGDQQAAFSDFYKFWRSHATTPEPREQQARLQDFFEFWYQRQQQQQQPLKSLPGEQKSIAQFYKDWQNKGGDTNIL